MMTIDPHRGDWSIKTDRLTIAPATTEPEVVEFVYQLWTNPKVMKNVGFPFGLKIDREQIQAQLESAGPPPFDQVLIVRRGDQIIGQAKLGSLNEQNIAVTDVKLAPEYWGRGYGREIKQALVDYLFTHTDCKGVEATPNRNNLASIKMQESVGGVRVEEGICTFPEYMRDYTDEVEFYRYIVWREVWEKLKQR